MLVLSRRKGEKLVITVPPSSTPQQIEVVYLSKDRGKLGVEAPPEVKVRRGEVKDTNGQNNEEQDRAA